MKTIEWIHVCLAPEIAGKAISNIMRDSENPMKVMNSTHDTLYDALHSAFDWTKTPVDKDMENSPFGGWLALAKHNVVRYDFGHADIHEPIIIFYGPEGNELWAYEKDMLAGLSDYKRDNSIRFIIDAVHNNLIGFKATRGYAYETAKAWKEMHKTIERQVLGTKSLLHAEVLDVMNKYMLRELS